MADISKLKLPGNPTIYNLKDQEARNMIENLPKSLVFKGTLGTDGTITALPEASASTVGHVYKVITAGTYAGKDAKVGDLFIGANTGTKEIPVYTWELVPSGDEPSGTVTNVGTGTGLTGGPITTTGTISVDFTTVAALDSPALSGTPTAPTVTDLTDSTTKIATTAFVKAVIDDMFGRRVTGSTLAISTLDEIIDTEVKFGPGVEVNNTTVVINQ